jgi:hydroxymethylglutaryl-CoA lyase
MAFGNPYGDAYSAELVTQWIGKMQAAGIRLISLADTVGIATASEVSDLCGSVVPAFDNLTIGVHLHSTAQNWQDKMEAAVSAGIQRFDGALKGFGGCPMAKNELVGNMNTEWMINWLQQRQLLPGLDYEALNNASIMAEKIFHH